MRVRPNSHMTNEAGPLFPSTRLHVPRQAQEVLLPVERIRGRPLPGRALPGHRLVAGEGRLEHALAPGELRQLAQELLRPRGGEDGLDRGEISAQRLRFERGAEAPQRRRHGPDRRRWNLELAADYGF